MIAADANLDGALDVFDVIEASAALATDAVRAPTVDCKADGALTIEDLTTVIGRVIEEPQSQRAALYSMALRNLGIYEPIAPPGAGVTPGALGGAGGTACLVRWNNSPWCWLSLGCLVLDFTCLAGEMAGATTGLTVLAAICHFARILVEIGAFFEGCLSNGACIPLWLEGCLAAIGFVSAICANPKQLLSRQTRDRLEALLRELGRGLGDIRL